MCIRSNAAVLTLGLAMFASGADAASDNVPVRKSGQWELKTISGATGTIVSRVCITPADHIIVPEIAVRARRRRSSGRAIRRLSTPCARRIRAKNGSVRC